MRISRDSMADWQPGANDKRLTALIPPRDYSDLNRQGDQLRLWLPESAKQGLTELAERAGVSMTVYLTEYFATYLYGHHELQRMRESQLGFYEPLMIKYCAMSAKPDAQPNLGKNIFALKIFVPAKLKQGLQHWADRAGVTLGRFARALVCAHLFGREYGPNELVALSDKEAHLADSWECESNNS